MSFAKHGIATQALDLGKAVLALSALGLFTKLLHIDLSQMQVLGVVLKPTNASLIPGFLGLALMYAFLCFVVARLEASIECEVDEAVISSRNKIKEKKGLLALVFLISPLSFFVYSMPYVFGIFSIILLWSDSMAVLKAIWSLST